MGLLGSQLGGIVGGSLGSKYGGKTGGDIGRALGTAAGAIFPYFKNGGKVNKTGLAMVHKNEYVLPKGVKPTKAQKAQVAKLKKRSRK